MANYLSLEEAAQKLGIPTDRLVELRSQGQVRGFRDGASWKFPETEIERLADDPDALGQDSYGSDILGGETPHDVSGSGVLVSENEVGSTGGGSSVIGSDASADQEGSGSGSGSDLEIGGETLQPSGSDVNLVAAEGEGSDVAIVASDSDLMIESASGLLEMESGELDLRDSGMIRDSAQLDLAVEPNAGSTGPVTDEELKEIAESHPDVLSPGLDQAAGSGSGSAVDLGSEPGDIDINSESDLSFTGPGPDEDSGEELIGAEEDSIELLGSDIQKKSDASKGPSEGGPVRQSPASSLELMDDLDEGDEAAVAKGSQGADVLSELDLLSAEQQGSGGLITGDSENLLGSSGLGSSIGADGLQDSDLGGLDDALADDDELVIADDDDDLVISSAGSDISVAGDSGINLMSPSDSGLSLESEPLDLAGSSISALDLGAELSEGGSSGSGVGSDGSVVDFQADEEFQLSASGVGLDADIESGSQVIEVEDSEAIAEPVEFAEEAAVDVQPLADDVFAAEPEAADAFAVEEEEGEAIAIDETTAAAVAPAAMGAYEVPFTLLQCVTLMLIICMLSLGGMLMTDLVRNMWTYAEPSAPVSALTDSLIGVMGWGQ